MAAIGTGGVGVATDWPSLAWTAILGGLTFSCLAIEKKFDRIAEMGAGARVVGHALIGYFGFGMSAFGVWCVTSARFPVPGGAAWNGPIAVVGGLAACVIGTTTLVQHCVRVRAGLRERAVAHVTVK